MILHKLLVAAAISFFLCEYASAQSEPPKASFFGDKPVASGFFSSDFVPQAQSGSGGAAEPSKGQPSQKQIEREDDFSFDTQPQTTPPTQAPAAPASQVQQDSQPQPKSAEQIGAHISEIIRKARTQSGQNALPNVPQQNSQQPAQPVEPPSALPKVPANAEPRNPILSLIVNAAPEDEFLFYLRELRNIEANFNVKIGQIIVVGMLNVEMKRVTDAEKATASTSEIPTQLFGNSAQEKALNNMRYYSGATVDFERLRKRLNISVSPTWVVRYRGADYVYEGINNPSKLFTAKGQFKDAENAESNQPSDTLFRQ